MERCAAVAAGPFFLLASFQEKALLYYFALCTSALSFVQFVFYTDLNDEKLCSV